VGRLRSAQHARVDCSRANAAEWTHHVRISPHQRDRVIVLAMLLYHYPSVDPLIPILLLPISPAVLEIPRHRFLGAAPKHGVSREGTNTA